MIKLDLWDVINAREPKLREDIPESLAKAETPTMDENLRIAVYHLLWVWKQYGRTSQYDGVDGLDHMNSTAGEDAADFLESLGLGHDQGYGFIPNEVAIALMDCEALPASSVNHGKLINYGGAGKWVEAILGPQPPVK
ncbi:MAG TPA: hypothetical protein VGC14_02570 [Rhizobium sp.]